MIAGLLSSSRVRWWACLVPLACAAAERVDSNVVFGMYSGLALLMDVHYPEKSNGLGIVFIAGSGWMAPQSYSASELKTSTQTAMYAAPLLRRGYTVFSVNHRAAPRFRYPAAVEDVQRAVRFIRYNASRFGIRAAQLGAAGGSSGGHLAVMLGVLDGNGDPLDADPVNRESAKVQCVVSRAAPVALWDPGAGVPGVINFLGMTPSLGSQSFPPDSVEHQTFRAASPLAHVSAGDAPVLMLHGDADASVAFDQSEKMEQALRAAGVPVKLLRIVGAGHGPDFPGAKNPPDYLGEMGDWFDAHLKRRTF